MHILTYKYLNTRKYNWKKGYQIYLNDIKTGVFEAIDEVT